MKDEMIPAKDVYDKFVDAVRNVEQMQESLFSTEESVLLSELASQSASMLNRLGLGRIGGSNCLGQLNKARMDTANKGKSWWQRKERITPVTSAGVLATRYSLVNGGVKEAIILTDTGELLSVSEFYDLTGHKLHDLAVFRDQYPARNFSPGDTSIGFWEVDRHLPLSRSFSMRYWSPDLRDDSDSFQPAELIEALSACIARAEEKMREQRDASIRQIKSM